MKMPFIFILSLALTTDAFAVPGGRAGNPGGPHANPAINNTAPPGLQNKALPRGLDNQDKTPSGWSRGEKTGWDESPMKRDKGITTDEVDTRDITDID